MRELRIFAHEAGSRLDRVLCRRFGLSRSQARRFFEQGAVWRNGRRAGKGEVVAQGDHVQCDHEEVDSAAQPDPQVPVLLRYEDDWLLVIDKPAGVPSHPLRPGELGCVANWIRAAYPDVSCGYDARQPGLVHRLDNDTSGLLLAARDAETFDALQTALEQGRIEKTYCALTSRPVEPQDIALSLAPGRHPRSPVQVASRGEPRHTRVVSCTPRGAFFLVEVKALRAYRHQVRAHLAAIGAPIVGDILYGGEPASCHHLHAARLVFCHPKTGAAVEVSSAIPSDWPLA